MRTRKIGLHRTLAGLIAVLAFATSAGAQTAKIIYRFTGSGGLSPNGGLVFDTVGNLYGTTQRGGSACASSSNGCGVVFELSPGSSGWTETVLHSFGGVYGQYPSGGVIFDTKGNLYGTTLEGGAYDKGTVFELSPTANGWRETVLYSFTGANDGGIPYGGVILDASGNIYGTTEGGGANNQGVLFQLTPTSGSGWTENIVLDFDPATGTGTSPLAIDAIGNLYGAAGDGQAHYNHQQGTIYKLSPTDGGWVTNILFTFQNSGTTGTLPINGVAIDSSGNLYGMTTGSVPYFDRGGTIYEIQSPSWTETVLGRLRVGMLGGEYPSGPMTVDAIGNLYGAISVETVLHDPPPYDGFVFRMGPSGNESYLFPPLPPADRYYPQGGFAVDATGNVYGTTVPTSSGYAVGEVFEITF